MRNQKANLVDSIYSTIIGGAIGDAMGVPVEFKSRDSFKVTGMSGNGTYNQPPGTWSDDTSLTLCLIENLTEGGDDEALLGKFSDYLEHGYMTPHGECFDIGGATHRAIKAFKNGTPANQCGQSGEKDNGNGSLMRIAPVTFLNIEDENTNSRLAKVKRYSEVTHAHPRSILGCFIYTEYLRQLFFGKEKDEALNIVIELCSGDIFDTKYQMELSHYVRILNGKIGELERVDIRSGGYVTNTLEAALWCFLKNNTYRDTVFEAVNLGGDTDTTGIVAGSMAGMFYGLDEIPDEWANTLAKIDFIRDICQKYGTMLLEKTAR